MKNLWQHRNLIGRMAWRDVVGRYKGSLIGLLWSFVNPVMMLIIYTFVFSVVFKARWGISVGDSEADFAIILFVGLVIHGLFAECVNGAPNVIVLNVNFVKKVIFPVEILPFVTVCAALFHTTISLVVLLCAQLFLNHHIPITAVLFPIILLPLLFCVMGLSWLIASLGVYFRDIGQLTAMFTIIMLYVSAVFFPISALPECYQSWLRLNPLAVLIEEGRKVLVFGQLPDFMVLSVLLVVGAFVAWLGFAWFQKTRMGFADVL